MTMVMVSPACDPPYDVSSRTSRFGLIPELFDQLEVLSNEDEEEERDGSRSLIRGSKPDTTPAGDLIKQWGFVLKTLEKAETCVKRGVQRPFPSPFFDLSSESEGSSGRDESDEDERAPTEFKRLCSTVRVVAEEFCQRSMEEAEREARDLERRQREADRVRELERRQRAETKEKEEQEEKDRQERQVEEDKRQRQLERKAQEEAELVQQQQAAQKKLEEANATKQQQQRQMGVSSMGPKKCSDDYLKHQLEARQEWKRYLDVDFQEMKRDADPEVKKFRIESKKKIQSAVNQLAATSLQIESVCKRLFNVLHLYSSSNNPKVFRYLAASIIISVLDIIEVQLAANPKSVWSYGMLLSKLSEIPEFYKTLDAAMKTVCVYCLPMYVHKTKQMSLEEFYLSRGQRDSETELAYFQRMASYLRLWLVLLIYKKDQVSYWSWWSRFVAMPPKRVSSFLLSSALEVSGFFGLSYFCPKQFAKLLNCAVIPDYLPRLHSLQAKDPEGILAASITQTNILLEEFRVRGRFRTPEGFQMKMSEAPISNL